MTMREGPDGAGCVVWALRYVLVSLIVYYITDESFITVFRFLTPPLIPQKLTMMRAASPLRSPKHE
jgi:hypothetical protein